MTTPFVLFTRLPRKRDQDHVAVRPEEVVAVESASYSGTSSWPDPSKRDRTQEVDATVIVLRNGTQYTVEMDYEQTLRIIQGGQ